MILRHDLIRNCWAVAACLGTVAGGILAADDPLPKGTSASKALQNEYLNDAQSYEFYLDAEKTKRLSFLKTPVMHWVNLDYSGDVFVWTHRGRPEIVGCMFSGPAGGEARRIAHEFHALTLQPLPQQRLGGVQTWALDKPAIAFKPLKNAPPPAETAAGRLMQMRSLSREFTATMQYQEKPHQLRLLPQPIYRYDAEAAGSEPRDWLDGGVFAFVWNTLGTDAEFLLVLEARKQSSAYQWQYSPVRFTTRELTLTHGDVEVWHDAFLRGQGPYTTNYSRTVTVKGATE